MSNSLKMLSARRSTLESLKIQGRALMHRGNVSMEEADSYIELADAVLGNTAEGSVGTTATENPDADAKIELAVMEVDRELEAANSALLKNDIGQVPPADSQITMDDDNATDLDQLIDEAEQLDSVAEVGYAMQDDASLDQTAALESYKALVKPLLRGIGVSQEQLETVDNATTIAEVVPVVEEVVDVAEQVIAKIEEVNPEEPGVSTESIGVGAGAAMVTLRRARSYLASKKKEG